MGTSDIAERNGGVAMVEKQGDGLEVEATLKGPSAIVVAKGMGLIRKATV